MVSVEEELNLSKTRSDKALTEKQKLGLEKMQRLNLESLGIEDYMQISGISTRVTAKNHLELFRELGILTAKKRGRAWVYTVNI